MVQTGCRHASPGEQRLDWKSRPDCALAACKAVRFGVKCPASLFRARTVNPVGPASRKIGDTGIGLSKSIGGMALGSGVFGQRCRRSGAIAAAIALGCPALARQQWPCWHCRRVGGNLTDAFQQRIETHGAGGTAANGSSGIAP